MRVEAHSLILGRRVSRARHHHERSICARPRDLAVVKSCGFHGREDLELIGHPVRRAVDRIRAPSITSRTRLRLRVRGLISSREQECS